MYRSRKKRKTKRPFTRKKQVNFLDVPTELLNLIFSFQSVQYLHSVAFLICQSVFKCLSKNENQKHWPSVYESYGAREYSKAGDCIHNWSTLENLSPLRVHNNFLREIRLLETRDETIHILQTSQTLTVFSTAFSYLQKRKYSDLAFLTALEIKNECGSSSHSLANFACPRLTKLSYLFETTITEVDESFYLKLEDLTVTNYEAKKLFGTSNLSSWWKWKNLQRLNVVGEISPRFQTLLMEFLPCSPLTHLNLNLSLRDITKSDLQNLTKVNLNYFCLQKRCLDQTYFRIFFSSVREISWLYLCDLDFNLVKELTCLENLAGLQNLSLSFAFALKFDSDPPLPRLMDLDLGKLELKKLEIIQPLQEAINVKIKSVEFLWVTEAYELYELPSCNTTQKMKIEYGVYLSNYFKTQKQFQLQQLQELSLVYSGEFISENFLKSLHNSSKLRFLSFSIKEQGGYKKEIKKMKSGCKKLGIFLSLDIKKY